MIIKKLKFEEYDIKINDELIKKLKKSFKKLKDKNLQFIFSKNFNK